MWRITVWVDIFYSKIVYSSNKSIIFYSIYNQTDILCSKFSHLVCYLYRIRVVSTQPSMEIMNWESQDCLLSYCRSCKCKFGSCVWSHSVEKWYFQTFIIYNRWSCWEIIFRRFCALYFCSRWHIYDPKQKRACSSR